MTAIKVKYTVIGIIDNKIVIVNSFFLILLIIIIKIFMSYDQLTDSDNNKIILD